MTESSDSILALEKRMEERRVEVSRLALMGFRTKQIQAVLRAKGEEWDESTIDDDLRLVRKERARWWLKHENSQKRFSSLLKEQLDKLDLVQNEAWKIFLDGQISPHARQAAAGRIIDAIRLCAEMLQFIGVTPKDLEEQKRIDELNAKVERLKKALRDRQAEIITA